MEAWSLNTLLICFGGGILGSALGGLFSFAVCGFIVILGCAVVLTGGSDFILLQIGLGSVFGPHVGGFSAGVVAGTYAAGVKKNHPGGAAKDILSPLMDSSWDVLIVGGIASVIGHVILQLLVKIPVINMSDCMAVTVVILAMGSRFLFQHEMPWGDKESINKKGYFNTDSFSISWCPWNASWSKLVVLGLGVGLLSGAIALATQQVLAPLVTKGTVSSGAAFVVSLILGWALAAISLMGMNFGTGSIQKFPVWHCQAILGALSYLLFGSMLVAGIVGILAGVLQEIMARMFWNHGSNHVDPPACAIAVGTLMLNSIKHFMG